MMGDIPIIGIIYYILYISQFDSATIYLFFLIQEIVMLHFWYIDYLVLSLKIMTKNNDLSFKIIKFKINYFAVRSEFNHTLKPQI